MWKTCLGLASKRNEHTHTYTMHTHVLELHRITSRVKYGNFAPECISLLTIIGKKNRSNSTPRSHSGLVLPCTHNHTFCSGDSFTVSLFLHKPYGSREVFVLMEDENSLALICKVVSLHAPKCRVERGTVCGSWTRTRPNPAIITSHRVENT